MNVGGVFTHFSETRQCATRWAHAVNPPPGASLQTDSKGNEHTGFLFFSLSTPLAHVSPLLCFCRSLAHLRRWLIIQKVTCGLLLLPLPPFTSLQYKKKKRKTSLGKCQLSSPRAGKLCMGVGASLPHYPAVKWVLFLLCSYCCKGFFVLEMRKDTATIKHLDWNN